MARRSRWSATSATGASAAAFDRVLFNEFTNDIARQTAFRNGEIDLFEARPEQYHQMKQEPASCGGATISSGSRSTAATATSPGNR